MKEITTTILSLIIINLFIIFALFFNQNYGYFMISSPSYNETYVSLRFDDGLKSQMPAFELLKKYNFTGSVYIISEKLSTDNEWEKNYYLNLEEIKNISEFMEIGSHTRSHADLIRTKDYESEILYGKKDLESYGFNISTLVYPGGNYNTRILLMVEKNFECASTQDVGTNGKPIRPHLLKDFTLRSYSTFETAKRVIKPGKWNILTFHDIGKIENEGIPVSYRKIANSNSFSLEEFEKILIYLKQNDISVVTIQNGCKEFK